MATNTIDDLFARSRLIVKLLESNGETSFQIDADAIYTKSLILGAASQFEKKVVLAVEQTVTTNCPGTTLVSEFINRQGLYRKYHTLFDWDSPNANRFFKLFGVQFSDFMKAEIKSDTELKMSIEAFMKIGRLRNELVHGDFALFSLSHTAKEVYRMFKSAESFVDRLPLLFKDFSEA